MKIVTLEFYSCNALKGFESKLPVSIEDAINFLNNIINEKCFFNLYLDINDDTRPYWQKTFSLQGCRNKQEAINFIKDIWPFVQSKKF